MTPRAPAPTSVERPSSRATSIVRGICAMARTGRLSLDTPAEYARQAWPADRTAIEIAQRAAVVPAMTSSPTNFAQTSVSDVISLLGPQGGAFAALAQRAMPITFGANTSILIPSITAAASGAFVAQGNPMPIRQLQVDSVTMNAPPKLAFGVVMSREIVEFTGSEPAVRAAITENLSLTLDSLLLDNTAASATRPAGLTNGLTPIAATSGGTFDAMITDFENLAAALDAIVGSDIVFLCAPKQAIAVALRAPLFRFPVISTNGLSDGTVVAIGPKALAIAGSDEAMRIEVSDQAVVHMEDVSPQPFSTAGATPSIAAPLRSAFQTDCVVIRLVCPVSWILRNAGAAAMISSVSW